MLAPVRAAHPHLLPGHGRAAHPGSFRPRRHHGRIFHLGLPGVHRQMDAPWGGDANGWVTVLRKARAAGLATNLELVSVDADAHRGPGPALPAPPRSSDRQRHRDRRHRRRDDLPRRPPMSRPASAPRASVLAEGPMRLVVVHFPDGAVALDARGRLVRRASVRVPRRGGGERERRRRRLRRRLPLRLPRGLEHHGLGRRSPMPRPPPRCARSRPPDRSSPGGHASPWPSAGAGGTDRLMGQVVARDGRGPSYGP